MLSPILFCTLILMVHSAPYKRAEESDDGNVPSGNTLNPQDELYSMLVNGLANDPNNLEVITDNFANIALDRRCCISVQYRFDCNAESNASSCFTFLWTRFNGDNLAGRFILYVDFFRIPVLGFDSIDVCDVFHPPVLCIVDMNLPSDITEDILIESLKNLTIHLPEFASENRISADVKDFYHDYATEFGQLRDNLEKYEIGTTIFLLIYATCVVFTGGNALRKMVYDKLQKEAKPRHYYYLFWSSVFYIFVLSIVLPVISKVFRSGHKLYEDLLLNLYIPIPVLGLFAASVYMIYYYLMYKRSSTRYISQKVLIDVDFCRCCCGSDKLKTECHTAFTVLMNFLAVYSEATLVIYLLLAAPAIALSFYIDAVRTSIQLGFVYLSLLILVVFGSLIVETIAQYCQTSSKVEQKKVLIFPCCSRLVSNTELCHRKQVRNMYRTTSKPQETSEQHGTTSMPHETCEQHKTCCTCEILLNIVYGALLIFTSAVTFALLAFVMVLIGTILFSNGLHGFEQLLTFVPAILATVSVYLITGKYKQQLADNDYTLPTE